MIALDAFGKDARRREADKVLARIPQRAFGDNAWVTMAVNSCAQHLAPAIASGQSHRIANAVRAIAYAPTPDQLNDVIGAACDAALSEAYVVRDTQLISNVASARSVIGTVIAEIRESAEREALAPAILRETVDGYVRIVELLDKRVAERLVAVGGLAARIGSTMHQSAARLLEIELAGRLHDIGTLTFLGTTSAADSAAQRPIVGETFLRSIPALAHLAPIVRSHREHFDGSGKPDGLRGEEIPLASRIISVAATFVELVTGTPQLEAMLPQNACRELALRSGTAFDPEVVTATMHLLRFRQRASRSA
jgi:response regulator RpfG family c-di-GMP phosphodiesterase